MAVQKRLGGLPLAMYLVALLVIPLAAVVVFSVREVGRNNSAAANAALVADASELQAFASAVYLPMEIERTALLAAATAASGSNFGEIVAGALENFDAIVGENDTVLQQSMDDLRGALDTPDLVSRHDEVVVEMAAIRSLAEDGKATPRDVTRSFDRSFAHLDAVIDSSHASLSVVESESLTGAQTVRHLSLVTDVVTTARNEAAGYSTIVFNVGDADVTQLVADGVRHVDALDSALDLIPAAIAPLEEQHMSLERSAGVPDFGGVDGVDITAAQAELVTDELIAHVDYLDSVARFALEQTTEIQSEVDSLATDARSRNQIMLLILGLVGVLSAIFTAIVVRSVVRPLKRLRTQAERISAGELHADLIVMEGPSDIREVTGAVNDMASTLSLVEDHMEALAVSEVGQGPELRELPGHVGSSMRTSMERITELTTRLQMSESRLAEEARIDNLTGLPNRQAVLEHLDQVMRSNRQGAIDGSATQTTGVMFLDVDGFKSVNDTHGHAVGDVVLRDIAHRLSASIRDIDLVARLGGDEFIVLVSDIADPDQLVGFGERMIEQVEQPYAIGDQLFVVSASVGIAIVEPGDNSLSAIERADAAVYQAKQRGRRRVEVFDKELQRSIEHQAELELALRQALQQDELCMYLQPLADLATGLPSGAEALVRWNRPGVGLVPPGDFIPIAERSGLIFELERWMLKSACSRIAAWRGSGRGAGFRLAVNISGRHLIEGNLIADIDAALAASGADPNLLEIELTESQLLDDVERASNVLTAVRQRGIKVAIDDFGTGYSSLTYLQRLPLDIVKIDRSFIDSATTSAFDSTIVDTVVSIGRALELEVVAEGIETMEQLAYARDTGLNHGQGFLLARPMPYEQAEDYLFDRPLFDLGNFSTSDPTWMVRAPTGPSADLS